MQETQAVTMILTQPNNKGFNQIMGFLKSEKKNPVIDLAVV